MPNSWGNERLAPFEPVCEHAPNVSGYVCQKKFRVDQSRHRDSPDPILEQQHRSSTESRCSTLAMAETSDLRNSVDKAQGKRSARTGRSCGNKISILTTFLASQHCSVVLIELFHLLKSSGVLSDQSTLSENFIVLMQTVLLRPGVYLMHQLFTRNAMQGVLNS